MHQQDVDEVGEQTGWDQKVGPPDALRGCESLVADGIDYSTSLLDGDLAFFLGNTYRSLIYADGGD